MRFIEWLCCRRADDLGWPLNTLNHLNFWLQIWCTGWMCKSQPTHDKLSVIGAWSGHVTHYKIFGASIILLERLNLKSSNFVHEQAILILATGWHIANNSACIWSSRDCFAVCRDAARRAGLSATAELLVRFIVTNWIVELLKVPSPSVHNSTVFSAPIYNIYKLRCSTATRLLHGAPKFSITIGGQRCSSSSSSTHRILMLLTVSQCKLKLSSWLFDQ